MRIPTQSPFLLSALLCLMACTHGGGTVDDDADTVLHVAVMPTLDCLPAYYADQNGLFDSLGLELKLQSYQSQADIDAALLSHDADIAYSDLCRTIILLQTDSIDLRVAALLEGRLRLMSDTRSVRGASQLSLLKGRMVGIARFGLTDYWSDRIAETAGLEHTDIFRPNIGDVRLRTDMHCNGTIEHALLPEPYATEAELRGRLCLMEIDSVAPQLAAFVAVRSSATDSLRHRQAALFLQGYDMAVAEINEALAHDNPATCDSLAQLLQRSYSVSDTLVYPVISRLPRLRPSAKPQRADAEAALVWLRDRDQERAEYRIIKPTYSLNHLFWQNGL